MLKKLSYLIYWLRELYWQCLATLLVTFPALAFGDDNNPFPNVDVNGDVTATMGANMERALKYSCLGIGGILIIIGILVLIHRLNEDSKNKEHGNLIMTIVLVGFCLTIGFMLIGIGWKAFNTQIQ